MLLSLHCFGRGSYISKLECHGHPSTQAQVLTLSFFFRRWLERMNAKLREAGKKEEKRRLKEFVENAYRCDPRVIAYKEAQRAER